MSTYAINPGPTDIGNITTLETDNDYAMYLSVRVKDHGIFGVDDTRNLERFPEGFDTVYVDAFAANTSKIHRE